MEYFANGYIQRSHGGLYDGKITIDGILLPEIFAVFFKDDNNENHLWIKRKKVLEYDAISQTYNEREAIPHWEAYLKKQLDGNTVAYKGEFYFMHFKYSIVGVWDAIFGKDVRQRLNLYVERLPIEHQVIINAINKRNRER